MTTPDLALTRDDAPALDVAAIEARAAAAARVDRYTLPAEVLASLADVSALLAALRHAHAALDAQRAECAERKALSRKAAQVLIAEVGASGPMSVLDAAERAVAHIARLDAQRAGEAARVAAAVAGERERCVAACREVALTYACRAQGAEACADAIAATGGAP